MAIAYPGLSDLLDTSGPEPVALQNPTGPAGKVQLLPVRTHIWGVPKNNPHWISFYPPTLIGHLRVRGRLSEVILEMSLPTMKS
jgi:hypothetical protein